MSRFKFGKKLAALLLMAAIVMPPLVEAKSPRGSLTSGQAKGPVVKGGVLQPLGGAKTKKKRVKRKVANGNPAPRQSARNKNRKNERQKQGKKMPKPNPTVIQQDSFSGFLSRSPNAKDRSDAAKLNDAIMKADRREASAIKRQAMNRKMVENRKKGFWTPMSSAVVNTPPPLPPRGSK